MMINHVHLLATPKDAAAVPRFIIALGGLCIPDTSANTISGNPEYAASGKSYAVVTPGCAFNAATGQAQPFVNLVDNGAYLLNVSVNIDAAEPYSHSCCRLSECGLNVISAANGSVSTDYYVRNGGTGTCTLP